MTGKSKCKILKDIRRQIAEKNGIELVIEECKYKGDCLGTCPRCEAEVRYLERELEKRRALGKKVAVAGLVATLAATSTGCDFHTQPQVVGSFAPETEFNETALPERYEVSSPSLSKLMTMNEEEIKSYISGYTRDQIRQEWRGRLVVNTDNTDKFKLPLYQKEYYVTITYDNEDYANNVEITIIADETESIPTSTTPPLSTDVIMGGV